MKVTFKQSIFMLFSIAILLGCNKENIKKENTKITIITVSDKLADCVGAHGKRKCLLIKDVKTDKKDFLYSNIEGFKYEEGFSYKLEVEISKLKQPIVDGSSVKYKLVKLISKKKLDNPKVSKDDGTASSLTQNTTASSLTKDKKAVKKEIPQKEEVNKKPIKKKKVKASKIKIDNCDKQPINNIKEETLRPMKKPILYLYPESDMDISVKLKHSENIVHSYPKYAKDGWKVKVKKDGTINYRNRKFYSLYWEMLDYGDFEFTEGFVVKKNDLIPFLEKSLKKLGLNYKESQEFIIYWLPTLEKNALSLIKFETSEYNKKQPIEIIPKPNTLIRIMMVFKKIDAVDILIKEQDLPETKRLGFTAVEWGGVEIK